MKIVGTLLGIFSTLILIRATMENPTLSETIKMGIILPLTGKLAEYDNPADYHGAKAYTAMYVIWDVLKRAKSYKHEDVRDTLAETDMMTVK